MTQVRNATVEDTLKSIIQKQNISHPENYLLYIPPPTPMWMDKKNALMNSFGLKNQVYFLYCFSSLFSHTCFLHICISFHINIF